MGHNPCETPRSLASQWPRSLTKPVVWMQFAYGCTQLLVLAGASLLVSVATSDMAASHLAVVDNVLGLLLIGSFAALLLIAAVTMCMDDWPLSSRLALIGADAVLFALNGIWALPFSA